MNTELVKVLFSQVPLCILITGATGFIGQSLMPILLGQGHDVIVLSRSISKTRKLFGDEIKVVNDLKAIDEDLKVDLVINLAGAKILGIPWVQSRKKTLLESRIKTTKALVHWIEVRKQKPRLLLSASAIGYYGIQAQDDTAELTEEHPPLSIFMSQLCQDWEAAAILAAKQDVAVRIMRFGVVLGKGGALAMMLLPIRMGFGGKLGSGKQMLSWIHIHDLISAMAHLSFKFFQEAETSEKFNVFNFTAPEAVSQIQFSQTAAKILHRPCCIPTPAITMKLLMGEQSDLLLEGQRVVPTNLLASGFTFSYPDINSALQDLL